VAEPKGIAQGKTGMCIHVRICTFIVAAVVLSRFASLPQEPKAAAAEPFPAGVHFFTLLKTDLSSKYSKVGDPVELEVDHAFSIDASHPLGMDVCIGDHTRLLGTVTMVRSSGKGERASVAMRIVEARSKSGSRSLDGFLGTNMLVKRTEALRGLDEWSPLHGFSLKKDPTFGTMLLSKQNFFLVKNQTRLEIITQ
jgi:hypothetical protein